MPNRPPIHRPAGHQQAKQQARKQYDQQRGSSTQRGYGSRWQRYRLWFLAQYPLCVMCRDESRVTPATDVDHIEAVNGPYDPLFWEENNHRPLCHTHHSRKTASEDGGFGRCAT